MHLVVCFFVQRHRGYGLCIGYTYQTSWSIPAACRTSTLVRLLFHSDFVKTIIFAVCTSYSPPRRRPVGVCTRSLPAAAVDSINKLRLLEDSARGHCTRSGYFGRNQNGCPSSSRISTGSPKSWQSVVPAFSTNCCVS